MKIILSRKGFDSGAGGMPSPIMPNGTLLSLPIPDKNSGRRFSEVSYDGKTYEQIIKELNPNFSHEFCHLDPDIRNDCINNCPENWRPAFGQQGAALTHLKNYGLDIGDLFIFFGWFRQTEFQNNGKLSFTGPDKHIIYGFMKVDEIIKGTKNIYTNCPWHPHSKKEIPLSLFSDDNNWLIIPKKDNYGVLKYSEKRVLTMDGMTRTKWNLPDFFKDVEISYHSKNAWKDSYFQSVARGQEFVITKPNKEILNWVQNIISD